MRAFLIIILILLFVGGVGTGVYFMVPPVKEFVDENLLGKSSPGDSKAGEPENLPDLPGQDRLPLAKPEGIPPTVPVKSQPPPPPRKLSPAREAAVVAKYPHKKLWSLEKTVGNWQRIPQKLFPREVTLRNGIEFPVVINGQASGTIPVQPGGLAVAVLQKGNLLLVRPNARSPYQKYVGLHETSLKEDVTNLYNKNLKRWHRYVENQRQDARDRILDGMPMTRKEVPQVVSSVPQHPVPSVPVTKTSGGTFDPAFGKAPKVDARGQVTAAVNSIRRNELKNCQLQFVQRWGRPKKERIKGRPYWTVDVTFLVDSIFGRFPQEAKAMIRNERVEKWTIIEID